MKTLQINEEFQSLIHSLEKDDLDRLEKSILEEGCRDPIVVWKGTIIDGHHRYKICQKHNIEFQTIEKLGLKTVLDVKIWMIINQLGRRNLTDIQRIEIGYQWKALVAEQARDRQLAGLNSKESNQQEQGVCQLVTSVAKVEDQKGKTLEIIADKIGVGRGKLEKYDTIQRKGNDEQKQRISSGEDTINKVYNEIQNIDHPKKKKAETPKVEILEEEPKYGVFDSDLIHHYFKESWSGKNLISNKVPYLLIYDTRSSKGDGAMYECRDCNVKQQGNMLADSISDIANEYCNAELVSRFKGVLREVSNEVCFSNEKKVETTYE